MIIPFGRRRFCLAIGVAAAGGGILAAIHYQRLGLTLSHYDARGHLVVARRIIDSITPGWQQVGAVWLPLPHLLNALPVQIDTFYRTGGSAVTLSIAAFAVTASALAWIVTDITGSAWAAVAAAAAFTLNPNVLYLQATPMTEPLLLALTMVGVALLTAWCRTEDDGGGVRDAKLRTTSASPTADLKIRATSTGLVFALACLTRYEAWPITAAALAFAAWTLWRTGHTWGDSRHRVLSIAAYSAAAIIGFAIFSRIVVGAWLVPAGFFVPENPARGDLVAAAAQVLWGVRVLSGYGTLTTGLIGLAALLILALVNRQRAHLLVPLSLVAAAALPWFAFVQGHPYRIRYIVPLLAAEAVGIGVVAGMVKRAKPVVAAALVAVLAFELRPLDARAPMVVEAQWDRPNVPVRQRVTSCLRSDYRGETIMASMGSLGHYMQELSLAGFTVRDFLHEGNGDIWLAALGSPRAYAGWILIEEQAEGGDMLATIARANPQFLTGFSRVCEGAGLALYRRDTGPAPQPHAEVKSEH